MSSITLIDGPMGTLLGERGGNISGPTWSAEANLSSPDLVMSIHSDYAAAGASAHTTNTFRTRRRDLGTRWRKTTALAVQHARQASPSSHLVLGSISPLADCYRPDLSPQDSRIEHREFIEFMAQQPIDRLLCETFSNPTEALVAVEECGRTGIPTWLALTAGPDGDLMSPQTMADTCKNAVDCGVEAVLVNCVDVFLSLAYVKKLATLGVPFGAYANAGPASSGIGWQAEREGPKRYLEEAQAWVDVGATIIGCCCGTGPTHIDALRRSLHS
jgi:S-methylmethionine-dependent homocysteine/selenocysteine methylase